VSARIDPPARTRRVAIVAGGRRKRQKRTQAQRGGRPRVRHRHVLSAMADTRTAHPEAAEPGAAANPRHVHGAVPDRILPGTEAVHHMQHRVLGGRVPHLLQRVRQLHILQQQLRLGAVRQRLTDDRKTGAREQPVVRGRTTRQRRPRRDIVPSPPVHSKEYKDTPLAFRNTFIDNFFYC